MQRLLCAKLGASQISFLVLPTALQDGDIVMLSVLQVKKLWPLAQVHAVGNNLLSWDLNPALISPRSLALLFHPHVIGSLVLECQQLEEKNQCLWGHLEESGSEEQV